MHSNFYLARKLSSHDKVYDEPELLSASDYIVVLAEPGAGKTALLHSLGHHLGYSSLTASKYLHLESQQDHSTLIIDGFDELAKIDQAGIYKLLAKAKKENARRIIISSRSSEWDTHATNAFRDFIGHEPIIVYLCEFNESDQRSIFEYYASGEDFQKFQAEVSRFDLEGLLPNPQFLKLFADAYIESQRHFSDKQSIFSQAIEHLAREVNTDVRATNNTLPLSQKVAISSEVFAKLLLSGSEGVSTSEYSEERTYPQLTSLITKSDTPNSILATRLFKPGDSADQHLPVHKIVVEYCAASYLINRLVDPLDHLTLPKILSIIAPNYAVRDELRGLIGWLASMGNKFIQEEFIELDPYAVLANGDPSQLEPSSKLLLIKCLKKVEENDPYFRRADYWRHFSVVGFFTEDIVDEIRPLLLSDNEGNLRDLILELLVGASATKQLENELSEILLASDASPNSRFLANSCLLELVDYDYIYTQNILIREASDTSLNLVERTISRIGPAKFPLKFLVKYFDACSNLYPRKEDYQAGKRGERYFIKLLIKEMDLSIIEPLLDELTKKLTCRCKKKRFECECLTGISKIVGAMLDRYFKLATPPFDPIRVWNWVNNLNFHQAKSSEKSMAVKVLQNDMTLRHGMFSYIFGNVFDLEELRSIRMEKLNIHCHSGLQLYLQDYKFLLDFAYVNDNPNLWKSFLITHSYNEHNRDPIKELRKHLRKQALTKPSFLRVWTAANRETVKFNQSMQIQFRKHYRSMRRHDKKKESVRKKNIQFIQENREQVESGRHWNCLLRFAYTVLNSPEKIEKEFGDEKLVRHALKNCLDFIAPHVPTLSELAELQCLSKYNKSEVILLASCLEIIRTDGNLQSINTELLKALRTGLKVSYSAINEDDRIALKAEIDRVLFSDQDSAEIFIRQYLEPQLAISNCNHVEVELLKYEESFNHLASRLSIEWLHRYKELSLEILKSLFEIASEYAEPEALKLLISKRCSEITAEWPNKTNNDDIEKKRQFWLLLSFYHIEHTPSDYWEWLKADKNNIFEFSQRTGRMRYMGSNYWPKLTSHKIECILDAYIEQWPKVEVHNNNDDESSDSENAYRFLDELVWSIDSDSPENAIPVLRRLLQDPRFSDFYNALKSIFAKQVKLKALINYEAPTPFDVVRQLDNDDVISVQALRVLVLNELIELQKAIEGGEFNSANRFFEKDKRLDEETCTEIIAERISLRLSQQNITVTLEHHLKAANRCDFTVSKVRNGLRYLVVTEVKGQWHKDLYSAATTQLHQRYSIHPDAAEQGIYLVVWFGSHEMVAKRKRHNIKTAHQLKLAIEETIPLELKGLIDIFVLDVSQSK